MYKLLLSICLLLCLSGCTHQAPEAYQSNLGASCTQHSDCSAPLDYLIQSNCPFGSACIDATCQVVCPIAVHDPDLTISQSYPASCQSDSDCDCTERGERSLDCLCLDGGCVSVEGR